MESPKPHSMVASLYLIIKDDYGNSAKQSIMEVYFIFSQPRSIVYSGRDVLELQGQLGGAVILNMASFEAVI